MVSRESFAQWYRNRFVWMVEIMLVVSAGTVALVNSTDSAAEPADLRGQIMNRMRTVLEQTDPAHHNHAGHQAQQAATETAKPRVICGVHVYGYEPAEASKIADVRTVYGFHLCGIAEKEHPWDVAVKLAGPLIMDMSTEPPGIQVVEATADVMYVDRLRQMFPDRYAQLALKEALADSEMVDLRRRYDAAAGL
ncbi:hypothetical protein [Micromonospora sp. KC721]|uniref:hypothetical protein n=1 Tax=Micromonospora sp. KC721 TaxID=2530380 RepID=UPI00104B8154|nr:hypothetical protein [Micromonospora sp. KC721]TDB79034.1 hypothetical protein E1182_14135 [Micromonospora sp. KC721]